jgi:hypothetical protein
MFQVKSGKTSWRAASCVLGLVTALTTAASGQVLEKDFNDATGTGGGTFFTGTGFAELEDWDDGIVGETAFAGTEGYADVDFAAAFGSLDAGVDGTGAGIIEVAGVIYDLLFHDFADVTGTGGGVFLAGGAGPDTFNFVTNWDDGIASEFAFGGTFDGAVLDGSMSAAGLPTGGIGGTGGALVDVDAVTLNAGGWYAGLQFDIGPLAGSAYVENAGFEGASAWTAFANAFESPGLVEVAPRTGSVAAKTYGAFSGPSGLYQDLPTQPGQLVEFSAYALTPSFDSLALTSNQAQLRIEWRDAANANTLLVDQVVVIDASDPGFVEDEWVGGTLTATAPAGAAFARVLLWFEQPGDDEGSVWWDDASVRITGPGATDLSQFELTVSARGFIDAPNEVLGGIQLRIEDPDGNRLFAEEQADDTFQTIGGLLSTLTEVDANGTPTIGAFNRNASFYRVVVAFSETNLWGTGGTIEIDDLLLSNDITTGSVWYAGMYFDDLQIPTLDPDAAQILDPSLIVLLADVKGDFAAPYALRLEALDERSSATDEDFDNVLGDCGASGDCVIYDPDTGGPGFTIDIDTGVEGEAAFAGVREPVFPFLDGNIMAYGNPTGGTDDSGCLTVEVQHITPGTGGTWYAGIDYGDQALASPDLSQVELTADIRGRVSDFGGLGFYELRIEDAEGDRLAFQVEANGDWQQVGGTLDTAVELPPADGTSGNGFDTNSPSYNVVVAFVDEPPDMPLATTWVSGGILDVDNLFLSAATQKVELGRFEFIEPGNTDFETVGGFISAADNITLELGGGPAGPVVLDFENGTPGASGPMNIAWDPALPNEGCFSGGGLISSFIETCADCGVGGSQAIHIVVEQASSGWWAGVYFEAVSMDLSAGDGDNLAALADQELFATVNALGSTLPYGVLEIRVEDAETDTLYFHLVPDGTEQVIGGTLDGATRGFADPNQTNGVFDYFQDTYNITIAFTNFTSPAWGGTIDFWIDDWTYTSAAASAQAPDSFTVTATFADEASVWQTGGQLTVDNVLLALVPNCNGDQSLDLHDIALVQQCFSGSGVPVADECRCGDLDGDGDVDADDDIIGALEVVPPALVQPD